MGGVLYQPFLLQSDYNNQMFGTACVVNPISLCIYDLWRIFSVWLYGVSTSDFFKGISAKLNFYFFYAVPLFPYCILGQQFECSI